MQLLYTVHSVKQEPVAVTALLNGRSVSATVPGLTVELVAGDHGHIVRFVPSSDAELASSQALFVVGASICATFAAAPSDATQGG